MHQPTTARPLSIRIPHWSLPSRRRFRCLKSASLNALVRLKGALGEAGLKYPCTAPSDLTSTLSALTRPIADHCTAADETKIVEPRRSYLTEKRQCKSQLTEPFSRLHKTVKRLCVTAAAFLLCYANRGLDGCGKHRGLDRY